MAVKIYDPNAPNTDGPAITVTDAARQYFLTQLQLNDDRQGVRLSVKESGCSGYQYVLDWVNSTNDQDIHIALDDQHPLLIDANALTLVQGTEIHLVKEGLNETIEFKNPNVTGECGCGESFSVTPPQSEI